MSDWSGDEDLGEALPEEEEDDLHLKVKPEELLQQLNCEEIAAREIIEDPLGAVPALPFGHLHDAWLEFIGRLQPGDELWSFRAQRMELWDRDHVHEGYAVVRDGRPRSHFVTGCLIVPVPDRPEEPDEDSATHPVVDESRSAISSAADVSAVTADKLAAYRATSYRLGFHADDIVLMIDKHSPELAALFAEHGVNCGAFITAYNPEGTLQSDASNEQGHQMLLDVAEALDEPFIEGAGQDPTGQWPPERSVFLFGIDEPAAKNIGRAFRQDAIVWVGPDAIPRLVVLR